MLSALKQLQIKHADHPLLWWALIMVSLFAAVGAAIALWLGSPSWVGALQGVLQAGILILLLTLIHVYRSLEARQEIHQGKQQAYAQILHLIAPRAPLPPMTQWAATPELALELIHQIMSHRPKSIVEFGSGCSSLIMGYMLEQQAEHGHLISIDHDKAYAQKTRRDVSLHGLDAHITVLDAPLESQPSIGPVGRQSTWYQLANLSIPDSIDLLVVDGPPEKTTSWVRYPAVPVLADKLSDHAVIVLHDTHRKDETAIVHAWQNLLPGSSVEWRDTDKGIAILHRGHK
ncbi:MAG: class I SAM-dependent methyltransferase [Balneolaceae bacterium]|nr:class I SAM-dependent methyltransferase [Balneolaceae bacterium]MDR9447042.1 class I SAM-dependent methyltransferase [Balneolaceae bacterium]